MADGYGYCAGRQNQTKRRNLKIKIQLFVSPPPTWNIYSCFRKLFSQLNLLENGMHRTTNSTVIEGAAGCSIGAVARCERLKSRYIFSACFFGWCRHTVAFCTASRPFRATATVRTEWEREARIYLPFSEFGSDLYFRGARAPCSTASGRYYGLPGASRPVCLPLEPTSCTFTPKRNS